MSKAPAFQFYPNDWSHDLEEHPLEIEGAWIRICCKLWWSDTRGQLKRTIDQWSRVLHVETNDCERIFNYIETWKIGDVERNGNGEVTVTSRRMFRNFKDSEFNRLRQYRWRGKHKSNAPVTEIKRQSNDHSSSSSSSSTSKQKKIYKRKVLTDEEWKEQILKLNSWVNWDDLNREMDTWLLNNPGREKTRRFIANWILRKQKDKPMLIKKPEFKPPPSTDTPAWIKDAIKEGWK